MYITLERCDIHWISWVRCKRPIGTQLRKEQKQKRKKNGKCNTDIVEIDSWFDRGEKRKWFRIWTN